MKTLTYFNNFSFTLKHFIPKNNTGAKTITQLVFLFVFIIANLPELYAQSVAGSTWDLATATPNAGYTNWGSGVISLTDTVTGSGACQGAAVTETSGYNPTTNFSRCFRVFFGCPVNDQIGTLISPYTDQNGDGLAFSFWKSSATYNANNANTCGGGLGYDNAISDARAITVEFDTYSSLGTSTVDTYYGGGAPGSGINDELSLHRDGNSNDVGLLTTTATTNTNAGNLEDGLQHEVCISYNATSHIIAVTIDAISKISYDLGASDNLNTYFAGATLNFSWSAGKYGANNLQTIGPTGTNLFAVMGRNPCTGVVMPVTLLNFSGKLVGETIELDWSTSSEENNDKFIIERSANGIDWSAIGTVKGNGNYSSIEDYNFIDYNTNGKIVYYRLKQVDFNGDFVYSNMVAIELNNQTISVEPNPFEDILTINSNLKGTTLITIYDLQGKIVAQETNENTTGTLRLSQSNLASGAYILTIQAGDFIKHQKIIKR